MSSADRPVSAPSGPAVAAHPSDGEKPSASSHPPAPAPYPTAQRRKWPWIAGLILLAGFAAIATPWLRDALTTVSTDDAYVNGHVTFVAPRVSGQVARVLVDDNNRVRKGDLLVQLDKEPYVVQLNVAKAAVDAAQSDLANARAQARGLVGQARSARFALEHAIEQVDNQVALLHA